MKDQSKLLEVALLADVPAILWGPPGIGKTATISKIAEDLGAEMVVLIGSTLDPTDIQRPIVAKDDTVKMVAAPWAYRIRNALDNGRRAILFLDELSSAPPSIQAAFLRIVQERMVGEVSIAGCHIVAAANPVECAIGGWELAPPTANRWMHVEWSVDPSEWVAGTLTNWGKGQSKERAIVASTVCSYINSRPSALLDLPKEGGTRGWPSPRSWTNFIEACTAAGGLTSGGLTHILAATIVGEGAAKELLTWIVDKDLPSPEQVLKGEIKLNPNTERADRYMAIMEGCVGAALQNPAYLPALWELIKSCKSDVALRTLRYLRAAKSNIQLPEELQKLRIAATVSALKVTSHTITPK